MIEHFEEADRRNPPPKDAILFVGSSTFTMWTTLAEDFKPLPVINRGFGGSTYDDLLRYMDRIVIPYRPRVIVLYEGNNDLAREGTTAEDVFGNLKTFEARTRAALPLATILCLSIKPSPSRFHLWPEVQRANRLIREHIAHRDKVKYIDITRLMLGADGRPLGDLFLEDRLHMNRQGYLRWIPVLRAELESAFGGASQDKRSTTLPGEQAPVPCNPTPRSLK